jgi:hypothetical protein
MPAPTLGSYPLFFTGPSFAEETLISISPCPEMKALADELAAALKQRENRSADNDPAELQANVEKVNELIPYK